MENIFWGLPFRIEKLLGADRELVGGADQIERAYYRDMPILPLLRTSMISWAGKAEKYDHKKIEAREFAE